MAPSSNKKYVVQVQCSLTHYLEYRVLRMETAKMLDNGAAFVKALDYLSKKYKINYIWISGYNSRANGIVERPHFDVQQLLLKAMEGEETNGQWLYTRFSGQNILQSSDDWAFHLILQLRGHIRY